jgi:hypothetical protein
MKMFFVLFICLFASLCFSQTKVADFHIHLTTKHYYMDIKDPAEILALKDNPAEIKRKYGNINWRSVGENSRAKRSGKESSYRNYNQADYTQLRNIQGSILFNGFYPFEKILTVNPWHRFINRIGVTRIGLNRLETIASDTNNPNKEFLAEYHLAANLVETNNGTTIKFVKNISELIDCQEKNITAAIMAIEGGQVFHGNYISSRSNIKSWECNNICEAEILNNVKVIKNLEHRLFFIGTSHFAWNRISGHAKTLDKSGFRRFIVSILASSRKQRESMFLKWGEGIHGEIDFGNFITTPERFLLPITDDPKQLDIGRKVITELLNPDNTRHGKPTYIDVKHMDIQAREEYYKLLDSLKLRNGKKIPIIASHTAVSGENLEIARATGLNPLYDQYSELRNPRKFYENQLIMRDRFWKSVTKFLYDRSYNPFENNINCQTVGWFYPWSFNLYDEEIERIHESDGIIGVMLDPRQLGSGMPRYSNGYKKFIKDEFENYIRGIGKGNMIFKEYWELEPLLRNMFYIAEHCGKKICWDHIAIGSDFDGVIDPHKIAPTALSYPKLKVKLVDYLKAFVVIHGKQSSLAGLPPEIIVEKFFFENGKRFTLDYF